MPRGLVLESSIQASVVKYARSKGLLAKKLSVQGPMGTSGWPDYQFFTLIRCRGFNGMPRKFMDGLTLAIPYSFFIEFKRPGGKLTPLQEGVRQQIVRLGFKYYLVDSTEQGKRIIDHELE